ncbi:hypothetical protein [Streptomyces sp. NPDC048411]|uniref:hypothetical protein n=1 Tax=Streptomyces sp. NPDC048411 TaxID=3157206 RepID=UPI0034554162
MPRTSIERPRLDDDLGDGNACGGHGVTTLLTAGELPARDAYCADESRLLRRVLLLAHNGCG